MEYLLAMDWTSTTTVANIASILLAAIVLIASTLGFIGTKDKSAGEAVQQTINNYKELGESLSATVAELDRKNSEQGALIQSQTAILAQKDAQIRQLEALIKTQAAEFAQDRFELKAQFDTELRYWKRKAMECEEKMNGK
jgi:hypothetical protein